jgi:DNA-binding NarL/FixJ family response regulator
MKRRIFVVDDHPLVCAWLASEIGRESDLAACGQAQTIADALRQMAAQPPDAAVVDLSLPDGSGLELIKDLLARHPNVVVLVLSMHDDTDHMHRALRAGALGYITKDEAAQNFIPAIRIVLAGKRYLSPRLALKLAINLIEGNNHPGATAEHLSDRESEIFQMLGRGCEISQIATTYHLSVSTVHTYCDRMKQKFGVQTERELLVAAVRWNQQQNQPSARI